MGARELGSILDVKGARIDVLIATPGQVIDHLERTPGFLCSIYAFVLLMKNTLLAPKLKDNTGVAAQQITDGYYVGWKASNISVGIMFTQDTALK
jgi:hypothetical protein